MRPDRLCSTSLLKVPLLLLTSFCIIDFESSKFIICCCFDSYLCNDDSLDFDLNDDYFILNTGINSYKLN
jgi:hypothetical protein